MNQEKNFKLTDAQKIEFGELAIKKLMSEPNTKPRFPANLTVEEIGPASVIFGDHRAENTLAFTFEEYSVECYYYFIGYPGGNYSDALQPLYLDYMCKTFGEPYREQALAHWQQHLTAVYGEYQQHRAKEIAKLTAKLDREANKIFDKQTRILGAILGKYHQKLGHCAAPDMALRDAAQDLTPDRAR